jgi:hypothetical protein
VRVPLPFERFAIETPLVPAEVAERLRHATRSRSLFRAGPTDGKPFIGSVSDSEFRIVRAINYRNSFLPVVRGRIKQTVDGTRVEVSMRLAGFVFAFMCFWLGFVALFFLGFLVASLSRHQLTWFVLFPLGMFVFGSVLTVGAFKLEAGRSRECLESLLVAEPALSGQQRTPWPEAGWLRWSDIRAAGVLGLAWLGCYAVAFGLAINDWIIRRAGCTNQQANDPSYICPSGTHVFATWAAFAGAVITAAIGLWPIRQRRFGLLVPVIVAQLVAIAVLAWIAGNPQFQVRHR